MIKNYSLIVSVPGVDPTMFELHGDRVGLGREADNQIRLNVGEVSSSHCEFRKVEGGGYEVVDLDSTNGTRVNGKMIEKHRLVDGDRILIGESIAVHFVELAEGEKPAEVAVEAGEGGKRAAAAYTQMDEKLKSIEADIVVRASELEAMQREREAKRAEYAEMVAALEELEQRLAVKKLEPGGEGSEEIRKLQDDVMAQTRRVQVLRTDLDGQAQQMRQLPQDDETPVVPVPMSASPHAPAPKKF
jgi:predicted component of type VI protein secretion system